MSDSSFTVLGISGSLRASSFNSLLVRRAAALAPEGVEFDLYEDIGAIPHFSQDLEGDSTPAIVDGRIYLRTTGHLFCFEIEDSK